MSDAEVRRLRAALAAKMRGNGKFVCGSQFRGTQPRERPALADPRFGQLRQEVAALSDQLAATAAELEAAETRAAAAAFDAQQAQAREQEAWAAAREAQRRCSVALAARDDVACAAMRGFDGLHAEVAALSAERDEARRALRQRDERTNAELERTQRRHRVDLVAAACAARAVTSPVVVCCGPSVVSDVAHVVVDKLLARVPALVDPGVSRVALDCFARSMRTAIIDELKIHDAFAEDHENSCGRDAG